MDISPFYVLIIWILRPWFNPVLCALTEGTPGINSGYHIVTSFSNQHCKEIIKTVILSCKNMDIPSFSGVKIRIPPIKCSY